MTVELENPEPVKNSNWHFLEVFLSKLDIFSRFQKKKFFVFFQKILEWKFFQSKILKKPKSIFAKKEAQRIYFMEEELQSALKTFLAEGDKVSRVDWGVLRRSSDRTQSRSGYSVSENKV